MKILNNKGPRIDPYGIAQITFQQSLKLRSFFFPLLPITEVIC